MAILALITLLVAAQLVIVQHDPLHAFGKTHGREDGDHACRICLAMDVLHSAVAAFPALLLAAVQSGFEYSLEAPRFSIPFLKFLPSTGPPAGAP